MFLRFLSTPTLAILLWGALAPSAAFSAETPYRAIGRYEAPAGDAPSLRPASEHETAYRQAVEDARVATAAEIVSDLAALMPDNPSLRWRYDDGTTRVLLVTWTGWDGYVGQEEQVVPLGVDVWSTAYPDVRDFAWNSGLTGEALEMRLRQRLGLPPDSQKHYVVEMWADLRDVFRPAPDPEVTDRQAELDFPQSDQYVTVAPAHRAWFESLEAQSYGEWGYPWTRLGYTYDWAPEESLVGFSEFVIRQGAEVLVESVMSTEEYAQQGNQHIQQVADDLVAYAEECYPQWLAPGLAIAIVHRDQVILARGFGQKGIHDPEPVDGDTLFQIGSATKSFTAALTARMIDDGAYGWADRVQTLIPEFQLRDPLVSQLFTVQDLMAQHSGLPPMSVTALALLYYEPQDLVRAMRYIPPVGAFRSDYAYQNGLFVVAGDLATQVTGLSFVENMERQLFEPIGMTGATADFMAFLDAPNRVRLHRYKDWSIQVGVEEVTVENNPFFYWVRHIAAAGSVCASASDMAQWLRFQLGDGAIDGQQVVSAENLRMTRTPQTMVGPLSQSLDRHYCMGWVRREDQPHPIFWHNGNTNFGKSAMGILLEEQVGIAVMANLGTVKLTEALMWRFFDLYLKRPGADYSADYLAQELAQAPATLPERPDPAAPARPLDAYTGPYYNPILGVVPVALQENGLTVTIGPGQRILTLAEWDGDTFHVVDVSGTGPAFEFDFVSFVADGEGAVTALSLDFLEDDTLGLLQKGAPAPLSQTQHWLVR